MSRKTRSLHLTEAEERVVAQALGYKPIGRGYFSRDQARVDSVELRQDPQYADAARMFSGKQRLQKANFYKGRKGHR